MYYWNKNVGFLGGGGGYMNNTMWCLRNCWYLAEEHVKFGCHFVYDNNYMNFIFQFFFFSARFCFLPPLNFFTHLFLFLFWFGNLLGFDIFFLFFFYGFNEFLVQIFLPQLYLKKIFKICQENPIIIRYYSNFVSFKFFFTKWIIILKLVSFSINKLINEYRLLVTIILINY